MMGYGFKADMERMTKELPKDQDGQFIDLSLHKLSARKCALQLLALVSANKSPVGPSLSTQTQAPYVLCSLDCNLLRLLSNNTLRRFLIVMNRVLAILSVPLYLGRIVLGILNVRSRWG
jgi:hypothetical protein